MTLWDDMKMNLHQSSKMRVKPNRSVIHQESEVKSVGYEIIWFNLIMKRFNLNISTERASENVEKQKYCI